MNQPEISVIIVSYNVKAYLQPCIKSVLQQNGISPEVVVVDNNSTDGTVEMLQQNFPSVKLIKNITNKGFSGANNQGIKASRGQYILLLNPDTEIKQNDCLQRLSRSIENNKDGIVAPCLLNSDGSYQHSYWNISGIKELLYETFYMHKAGRVKAKPQGPLFVEAASGAALLMERTLVEKIGLLDENMFWMEDTDFCYRVREAGGKVLYNPEEEIIHHGGKSSGNYSVVIPNQVISKIKFYKKHGTWIQYASMCILSFLFITSRFLMFALLSMTLRNTFVKKCQAYGIAFKWYIKYVFSGVNTIANIQ
jgi:GT2 family glycosyltransferase